MSAIKNISLYIPHVFPNFDREYVAKAFKHIGEVSQIDFVAKQDRNGNNYNSVYVHFNRWFTNKKTLAFYESVIDDTKEARLTHDEPWYWIVLPNTAKKHVSGERKPRLDLGEARAISSSTMATNILQSQKRSYADVTEKLSENPLVKPVEKQVTKEVKESFDAKQSSEINFDDVAAFEAEIYAQMDEIEELLEEEDANLISIDGRYVEQIESENWAMNMEIIQLRAALINLDQMYQAEAAKVRAFNASSVDL